MMRRPGAAAPFRLPSTSSPIQRSIAALTGSSSATSNTLTCSPSVRSPATCCATFRPPENYTAPLPFILKALSAP
eukprot:1890445-Pleurochrysis_carterae.AAC.4